MVLAEHARNLASRDVAVRAPARLGAVDLTPHLRALVAETRTESGCCVAFVRHTTCSLLINEWEDGCLDDLKGLLERLAPRDAYYAHDDLERRTQNLLDPGPEPANGAAHLAATLVGASSQTIPIVGGEPALGRWQSLILLELDEPRERSVVFQLFGS